MSKRLSASCALPLDAPHPRLDNAGFLRPDARLRSSVSRREDQSNGPVSLYVDFFRNIKDSTIRSW